MTRRFGCARGLTHTHTVPSPPPLVCVHSPHSQCHTLTAAVPHCVCVCCCSGRRESEGWYAGGMFRPNSGGVVIYITVT